MNAHLSLNSTTRDILWLGYLDPVPLSAHRFNRFNRSLMSFMIYAARSNVRGAASVVSATRRREQRLTYHARTLWYPTYARPCLCRSCMSDDAWLRSWACACLRVDVACAWLWCAEATTVASAEYSCHTYRPANIGTFLHTTVPCVGYKFMVLYMLACCIL